jgi:paraquat-inducible protein A
MLDVFVVALTIVSVKLGALATAQPRPGIYVFTASVLLSMIATVQAEKVGGS